MLFYGDRNHGCRCLEVMLHGYRTLIVENNKIRVMLLVDKGLDILEFNYKPQDMDFVWRAPQGLSILKKMQSPVSDHQYFIDYYTGGWFECFPNVGEACNYLGAQMPIYGEVCYLPWEYSIIKDSFEELSIKFITHTIKTPYCIEKSITIKNNDASLYIAEKVKNNGSQELQYQWGFHPNISSNFLFEETRLELPECETYSRYASETSEILQGSTGKWPFISSKSGEMTDLSVFNMKTAHADDFTLLKDLKAGRLELHNKSNKLKFMIEWDLKEMPHASIWRVNGKDKGYPRYGKTNVLGFVITSDLTWGLDNADKNTKTIKPEEEKSCWFKISVEDDAKE